MNRFQSFRDFLAFMAQRKKWVFAPVAILLFLMALFILLAEIPVLTPFIYALF